jgi:hypothetical protein
MSLPLRFVALGVLSLATSACAENITFPENVADILNTWQLANPFDRVTVDPYSQPLAPPGIPGQVCAAKLNEQDRSYSLITFASEEEASQAGPDVAITHGGPCGVCSTFQDLGVYAGQRDLTNPVRKCGFRSFLGEASAKRCLARIGFSEPCADIWFYNTKNTRKKCLGVCLWNLNKPNNLPDGRLNPCLLCDEEKSGPVFKQVSGRTRRNSGIQSAISRPEDQVYDNTEHKAYITPYQQPGVASDNLGTVGGIVGGSAAVLAGAGALFLKFRRPDVPIATEVVDAIEL